MQQPNCPAARCPPASPEWSAAAPLSGLAAESLVLASQFSVPCPPVPQPAASDAAVGLKRCRSSGAFSAFEPYPLGGPAAAVLASRAKRLRSLAPSAQLADAAAATQTGSQTSSESAGSAGARSCDTTVTATADSASVAAEAALAAYQARKHLQMLRRAASLLPKLPPAAQAVLLLRLRVVARRRAAAAAAAPKAAPAARCAQGSCCVRVGGAGAAWGRKIPPGSRGSSWCGGIPLRPPCLGMCLLGAVPPLPTLLPALTPSPQAPGPHAAPRPRDGPRPVQPGHGFHPGWHAAR
jgi:hypothetical protein